MDSENRTLERLLKEATAFLQKNEILNPRLDAEILLAHCLGVNRIKLYTSSYEKVDDWLVKKYFSLIERRLKKEPIAYILGEKEFMELNFKVSPKVLIPRPETEILVENALAFLDSFTPKEKFLAVDVGTGSGAIALSLAFLNPKVLVYALDISEDALKIAKENMISHGLLERVILSQSDLLASLPLKLKGKIDLITANLPYIPSKDIDFLMNDVKNYEPSLALDGGEDGLELYKKFLPSAFFYLRAGGVLFMEIGLNQKEALVILMQDNFEVGVLKDLAGYERIVWGIKK